MYSVEIPKEGKQEWTEEIFEEIITEDFSKTDERH